MAAHSPTPPEIRTAYDVLKAAGVCTVASALEAVPGDCSVFQLAIDVPAPNKENLPPSVTLRALVPHTFPYDAVIFIPIDPVVRGFPHQDAETGKLCLPRESAAPWDSSRLTQYVRWAREWLHDAANGTLLKDGDPYELPDFSRKAVKGKPFPDLPPVLFAESNETFPIWSGRIGQCGVVECSRCKDLRAILARTFMAHDGTVLLRNRFSPAIVAGATDFKGQWLLLPGITVHRHRPAQTYEELFALCRSCGAEVRRAIRRAWAIGHRSEGYGLLLVGFPIPRTVGQPPSEIHWQPIVFTNQAVSKKLFRGKGKADEGRLWSAVSQHGCFKPGSPLLWTRSTNLDDARQYARGSLPLAVRDMTVALVGCGALGSMVAEAVTRSGLRRLSLFDGDVLEYGNLGRHSLDGRHVGLNKAVALARRLSSANPLTEITGYEANIPLSLGRRDEADRAIHEADVLIDCSTDHGAFLWMSRCARSSGKRLASLFINAHATLLTLILSGRNTSGRKVFDRLNETIAAQRSPVPADEYFGGPIDHDVIIPGPGCWHPTFPAHNRHIWLLACAALDLLIPWMQGPYRCDGHGILVRRTDATMEGAVPVLDIWEEPYR
jgi:molybdopterin/thiamine biosynthesis adenylyltransferase